MSHSPKKYRYLFGPVPSRRLGKSLGVDIVPMKTCTQNCLYCQLGKDAPQALERRPWVPIDEVMTELKDRIDSGLDADAITISGSGEPTLHSRLGQLIDRIHAVTDIPVAVITNGTLLRRPDVRRDCAKADMVLPSLDAGDEAVFRQINQPHPEIHFDAFVEGLVEFREEYSGMIWLEVFFCQGINTDDGSVEAIRRLIEKVRPDRVQLNTAVRPTSHREALAVDSQELEQIAGRLGPNAEVIADFPAARATSQKPVSKEDVLETLRRRPCTLEDLTRSLGIAPDQAKIHLEQLTSEDIIDQECRAGKIFYSAR